MFRANGSNSEDYAINGIVFCKSCNNAQDVTCGTICSSCEYENNHVKRLNNKAAERKDAERREDLEWINKEKKREATKEEYVQIAKMILQKESEKKFEGWKNKVKEKEAELKTREVGLRKAYDEKIILLEDKFNLKENELKLEEERYQKLSNEKIQDLIKLPEVIEKAKLQIHEENRLEKLEKEEKKNAIKAEFMDIVNFIRTDFFVDGKIHDEGELEGQLRQVLRTQFKNIHEFERQEKIDGGKNRLDILIDKKYVIELKIPESNTSLRDLYGQLRDYNEFYGDKICVFILKQEKFDSKVIDLWVKRYKEDFGIESIVKKGEKIKPKVEGLN